MIFGDSGHGGDRRKRSQNAMLAVSSIHKSFAFQKSRAMLGTVGPIGRARVLELMGEDPDKPASPPARVPLHNPMFSFQYRY